MCGALHVAEQLLVPDGTPFDSLPKRGKGVGLLAHATNMYRHIKAEQDAGHRSKGFAEKHLDAFLQKKKDMKSAANGGDEEKEPLIARKERSRCESGQKHQRCESRSRKHDRRSGRSEHPIFVPVQDAGMPPGVRGETRAPSQSARSGRQSEALDQGALSVVNPSRRSSHNGHDDSVDPDRSGGGIEGGKSS